MVINPRCKLIFYKRINYVRRYLLIFRLLLQPNYRPIAQTDLIVSSSVWGLERLEEMKDFDINYTTIIDINSVVCHTLLSVNALEEDLTKLCMCVDLKIWKPLRRIGTSSYSNKVGACNAIAGALSPIFSQAVMMIGWRHTLKYGLN